MLHLQGFEFNAHRADCQYPARIRHDSESRVPEAEYDKGSQGSAYEPLFEEKEVQVYLVFTYRKAYWQDF